MQSFLFKADKLRDVLKRALKERIEGQKYDPVKGSQAGAMSVVCCPVRPVLPILTLLICCALQQAKQLADDIREWVKALGFERHKLVIQVLLHAESATRLGTGASLVYHSDCRGLGNYPGGFMLWQTVVYWALMQVTLGQKCGQAQRSAARCLWDPKTDGAVSEFCENESLFCICQVMASLEGWAKYCLHLVWPANALWPHQLFSGALPSCLLACLQVYCLYFQ